MGQVDYFLHVDMQEVSIFPRGECGFDDRHAVEVSQEVGSFDTGGVNLSVAQHNEESAVSAVQLPGDYAEVL